MPKSQKNEAGYVDSGRRLRRTLSQPLLYLLIFGLFLTMRGYHCRDGDQAYRLPLLLHRQDPSLFADDPFVRSFDTSIPIAATSRFWTSRVAPLASPRAWPRCSR